MLRCGHQSWRRRDGNSPPWPQMVLSGAPRSAALSAMASVTWGDVGRGGEGVILILTTNKRCLYISYNYTYIIYPITYLLSSYATLSTPSCTSSKANFAFSIVHFPHNYRARLNRIKSAYHTSTPATCGKCLSVSHRCHQFVVVKSPPLSPPLCSAKKLTFYVHQFVVLNLELLACWGLTLLLCY